ncbi:uncharacterized protein LOC144874555 [Branchiostoma floridae x Branchiostoma japonicum]
MSKKAPYPAQQPYPTQGQAAMAAQPPQVPGAPPPYMAHPQGQAPPPYTYQQAPTQYAGAPPMQQQYGQPPVQVAMQVPYYAPGSTVHAQGAFDSGARFSAGATPNIPPPPPGVMPNQAQLAAAQGATVVATQQKSDFFTGGSGGGYSLF